MIRRRKPPRRQREWIKRTARPRRQRKGTVAALKRKLDALARGEARSRGICEDERFHECKGGFHGAHGFSVRYLGTRWDHDNLFCLCAGAHTYYTLRPEEWTAWLMRKIGLAHYLALQAKAFAITHVTRDQLEARLVELSAKGGL